MAELTAWNCTFGHVPDDLLGETCCGDVEGGPMPEDCSGYARRPAVQPRFEALTDWWGLFLWQHSRRGDCGGLKAGGRRARIVLRA
ncbi:hypothetical protein WSS_A41380 [Rhodococcus opacus M213]|uniref:Uncharacterized protein n=1 Tax=Rhodococcus opacus M213 TaxID=1129896 RepID=K8X5A3_RHOOP|nr:hypothetical protein WSS_A41380 [Rhodococcus opacus M213]